VLRTFRDDHAASARRRIYSRIGEEPRSRSNRGLICAAFLAGPNLGRSLKRPHSTGMRATSFS
jgi:hypothetical protein